MLSSDESPPSPILSGPLERRLGCVCLCVCLRLCALVFASYGAGLRCDH